MIYLLDSDILSVDLKKIYINTNSKTVKEFCDKSIYYKDGLAKLDMDYINDFKNIYPDIFDNIIRNTRTRVV